jgi:hypothetical protein
MAPSPCYSFRRKVPGVKLVYSSIERRRQHARLSSAPAHHVAAGFPFQPRCFEGETNCSTAPSGILILDLITFLLAGTTYRCLSENACTSRVRSVGTETGHICFQCFGCGNNDSEVWVVVCGDDRSALNRWCMVWFSRPER